MLQETVLHAEIQIPFCVAAVVNSGVPGADEREVTKVMSAIADRVVHEFVEPFVFPNHHHRILEPYNYYDFGQVGAPSEAKDYELTAGALRGRLARRVCLCYHGKRGAWRGGGDAGGGGG